MADLQAAMWYPEKVLYESFKVGESFEKSLEGYTEDSTPDYFNAAKKLAKTNNISDEKINQAVSNGRRNRSSANDSIKSDSKISRNQLSVIIKQNLKESRERLQKKR